MLPFENRSEEKGNAYFADGVQGEILTDLAKVADLKVISRTSVMQYQKRVPAQRTGKSVRNSASRISWKEAFNVLGTVCASTCNWLMRALTGSYGRRPTTGISPTYSRFKVKSQRRLPPSLVQSCCRMKKVKSCVPRRTISPRSISTPAPRIFFLTPSYNISSKLALLEAENLLNQSVARDPSFVRAYCQLAFVHDALYFFGHDHTSARLAQAETAIQTANGLGPDAGETHLARAWNLYWGYLDYDGALAELKIASQTMPNDPQLLLLTGSIQRRQGHWEESIRTFERAANLDPRNFGVLQNIEGNYATLGRYAEQQRWLDRILALEPDDAATRAILAEVDFQRRADTQPLHRTIDSVRATNPAAVPSIVYFWLLCALAERDVAAAKEALIATREDRINLGDDVYCTRPFMEGVIARMAKDDGKARSAFTEARAEQEKIVGAQPNFGPSWCVLGLIDAALGHKEEALREGRRAVELLPVEKDGVRGLAMIKYLAMIAAWVGDNELACQQLAVATRPPRTVTYGQLKLLPFWDPLRGDPCFEKLVASLAPKRTKQESNTNRH